MLQKSVELLLDGKMIANSEDFGCHAIPSEMPTFTTPTLDFQSHSAELQDLVDKLYSFKDSYFLINKPPALSASSLESSFVPETSADRLKNRDETLWRLRDQTLHRFNQLTTPPIKKKKMMGKNPLLNPPASAEVVPPANINTATHHLFDPTLSSTQKSMYHFLRGRILDVDEAVYSKPAEEELGKAVKLNPKFVQGWNSLGECMWKKGDRNGSIYCFKAGLKVVIL